MIARLTKVLSRSLPLLDGWMVNIQAGRSISALQDRHLSPVSLKYVADGLARIAISGRSGIYHLTGDTEMSYYEFAKLLAAKLGASGALVLPTQAQNTSGLMQLYSALGAASAGRALNVIPEQLAEVMRNLTFCRAR